LIEGTGTVEAGGAEFSQHTLDHCVCMWNELVSAQACDYGNTDGREVGFSGW